MTNKTLDTLNITCYPSLGYVRRYLGNLSKPLSTLGTYVVRPTLGIVGLTLVLTLAPLIAFRMLVRCIRNALRSISQTVRPTKRG